MTDYPKLKDRIRTESEITQDIRYYLKESGIWHYKQWQGLGSLHGISDIIGIYKGKYLAIEVKRPGLSPTDKQQAFLKRVHDEGGLAVCVHSYEELADFIEKAGGLND
jgi:Holliday junction resolvase